MREPGTPAAAAAAAAAAAVAAAVIMAVAWNLRARRPGVRSRPAGRLPGSKARVQFCGKSSLSEADNCQSQTWLMLMQGSETNKSPLAGSPHLLHNSTPTAAIQGLQTAATEVVTQGTTQGQGRQLELRGCQWRPGSRGSASVAASEADER